MQPQELQMRAQAAIEGRLVAYLTEKAEARTGTVNITAGNVGQCPRKLWLQRTGAPQEPLNARALAVFDLGNRVEDSLLSMLIDAGVPLIRSDEKRDTFTIDPPGIRGRPDVFLDIGDGVHLVGDVKSMAPKSFERAERGDWDFSYLAQVECYMRGLGTDGFLYGVNKENGNRILTTLQPSDARWARVLRHHAQAMGPAIPDRPYAPIVECSGVKEGKCVNGLTPKAGKPHTNCGGTGREPGGPWLLNYPCGYCPVKRACWPGLELVLQEGEAPRWRIHG